MLKHKRKCSVGGQINTRFQKKLMYHHETHYKSVVPLREASALHDAWVSTAMVANSSFEQAPVEAMAETQGFTRSIEELKPERTIAKIDLETTSLTHSLSHSLSCSHLTRRGLSERVVDTALDS